MANEPEKPVNDSIDELLDGLPAEPMLPKKRARPIDQAASPSAQNRRADDKVIVRDDTDPRERARMEAEAARRQSSTFGTSFLGPNATKQKIIAFVAMMGVVLGVYGVVRSLRKNEAPQSMQNTTNAMTAMTPPSAPPPLTAEALPPVPATPIASATTTSTALVAAPPSSAPHRSHAHAAPSASAETPIPWATSRSGS
jgi:hypothetical protein